jgi:hypothetical protein
MRLICSFRKILVAEALLPENLSPGEHCFANAFSEDVCKTLEAMPGAVEALSLSVR